MTTTEKWRYLTDPDTGGVMVVPAEPKVEAVTEESKAPSLLNKAATIMTERGKQYDKPNGERSMLATIKAFNAVTGRDLCESEGWLLMQILKDVRLFQNRTKTHEDSVHDGIAYAALKGESALNGGLS